MQLATFGRRIAGDDDTLPGFRLDDVESTDERGASTPHGHRRRSLRHTGDPHDRVIGTVLHLTGAELGAADECLISDSRRIPVALASGATAWVYAAA